MGYIHAWLEFEGMLFLESFWTWYSRIKTLDFVQTNLGSKWVQLTISLTLHYDSYM